MKKLFKRNEAVNNSVEAFETKIACGCQCTCKCGCGVDPHSTVFSKTHSVGSAIYRENISDS